MTDLIDTTEMYLRTILELEEEDIVPLRARISERLGHSGPTVSQTIGRMERDGLVVVSDDRSLELTDAGRQKAVDVMRKHRLAERLLSDVIGLVRALNAQGGPIAGTVRRLAEPVQVDPELLEQLRAAGVVPGATGQFQFSEGYVLVEMDGREDGLELPVEVAAHIFLVEARARV
ncbi:MAG: metal-dependent transcriptional regulator [Microbacterium sp.]|nr:MAG: metal-dependent transcriptional regulator [Microbacterium sp.]